MQIKIQCACGTKFAFDVEPDHGHMPVRIQCPACHADCTGLANDAIAAQLAPSAPAVPVEAPKIRVRAAAPKPPETAPRALESAPETTKPRVRLAGTDEAAAPTAEDQPQACAHHPNEPAVEHCRVCGEPICPKCMEMFGYVCSVFCRTKAEREYLEVPVYAQQRSVVVGAARAKARLVFIGVVAVVALLLAGGFWWTIFGTKPSVKWSLQLPPTERGTRYEMLGPTEILVIKERQLALLDIAKGKEVWSTPLEAAKPAEAAQPLLTAKKTAPAKATGTAGVTTEGKLVAEAAQVATGQTNAEPPNSDEEEFSLTGTPAFVTVSGGAIWLQFVDRLASYDRQTGARKQEVPLKQPLVSLMHNDTGIVAVLGDERSFRTVTCVALPDGGIKSEQVAPSSPTTTAAARRAPAARSDTEPDEAGGTPEASAVVQRDDFLPAGPNVAEFATRLLEQRTAWREGMKPKSGDGILDSGRLSAGQSMDAVKELMNDMRRSDGGGKVAEDVSRYRVTLRRLFGTEAPDWNGEVIGPPCFFPLKTVDVVCGAKQVIVFDKANKKRWQATNTFNLNRGFALGVTEAKLFPCVETADALYVFDQGILTCFELATGQARWRLTSVGISRVQTDVEGKLYVNTTTASPDLIDFPKQFTTEKPRPVILRIDPANGKVLWKVANIADECILTGKFVYAARTSSGVYGTGTYFNLYRLNPADGKELWHYYAERWPRNTGYHDNQFMLQWKDEVQVLKFLSL